MLEKAAVHPIESLKPVVTKEELLELQKRVKRIHVDRSIRAYIVDLVQQSRIHPSLLLGASPRAARSADACSAGQGADR